MSDRFRPFLFDNAPPVSRAVLFPAPISDAIGRVMSPAYAPEITSFQQIANRSRIPRAAWEAIAAEQITKDSSGQMFVNGAPVTTGGTLAALSKTPPYQEAHGPYGDMQDLVVVLAANQSVKVLTRPAYRRILLQLQNSPTSAGSFNYAFGKPAGPTSLAVAIGGSSSYLDAVPQNELWLFSTLGATATIAYIDDAQPDQPVKLLPS